MRYERKLYEFSLTWVEQKLDALCLTYLRDWLEMPASPCANEKQEHLKRWNRIQEASFVLCAYGKPQTNKHVLSNYGSLVALHRYTDRHNNVLTRAD